MSTRITNRIAKLRGSDRNHPERYNPRYEHEPSGEELDRDPPEHWNDFEKLIWKEFTDPLPEDLLYQQERGILELTVKLWADLQYRHRAAARKGMHYLYTEYDLKVIARIEAGLKQMGLTPVERSRIFYTKAAQKKQAEKMAKKDRAELAPATGGEKQKIRRGTNVRELRPRK